MRAAASDRTLRSTFCGLPWVGDDDLVFPAGSYLDGSAPRRRYGSALARAGLRPLRFHDLRRTFGTRMIAKADIRRAQEWTGHAEVQTTMRYLHYAPRADDAALVAQAFADEASKDVPAGTSLTPPISSLHGIVILMFSNERAHAAGHFHARHAEYKAPSGFDGALIAGALPPTQLHLVTSWAERHRVELEANWERARLGQPLEAIDPLA